MMGQAQILKPPGAEKLNPNTNYNGVTLDVSASSASAPHCIDVLLSRVFLAKRLCRMSSGLPLLTTKGRNPGT